VLYPAIMADLGFDYAQLGILTALRNLLGNAMQIVYGMLTPFVSRTRILAWGNFGIAVGTLVTGLVGSFPGFFMARSLTSVASSAQHPVGMSILSGYFPTRRGMILALNNSIANVGSLLAPLAGGVLLYVIGWRNIFLLVAGMSVVIGVVYLLVADRGAAGSVDRKARLASGLTSYKRVLKHRNIMLISCVMMVGAAGRGDGVQTYLAPHLVNDLSLTVFVAGLALTTLQAGAIVGPIVLGWLSDRYSRKGVLQLSLVLSAGATWWLAYQGAHIPSLMLSMLTFGAVTTSRNSLTQALIADSLGDQDRDAAFSVYYFVGFISDPVWSLLGGFLMQGFGFELAFSRLAVSYLVGMVLVIFVVDPRTQRQPAS
jgi:MFS family permease